MRNSDVRRIPIREAGRPRIGFACAVALVAFLGGMPAARAQWGQEKRLSNGNNGDKAIASSGRFLHVAYGTNPVLYRRSGDEGSSFEAERTLASTGQLHETDSLFADGSNVYFMYMANLGSATDWCCAREIGDGYFRRSTNDGQDWDPPLTITDSGAMFRYSLAASGSTVHLVWSDFRTGKWQIYYRRSTDGGAMFAPEQVLVPSALEEVNRPQIAVNGNTVHVAWNDNRDGNDQCYTLPHCVEVYYRRSLNGGVDWEPMQRLTMNPAMNPTLAGRPDIGAFSNGNVFILYDQDPGVETAGVQTVLLSTNAGVDWGNPLRLANTPPEQTHGSAAAEGAIGVAAWFDQSNPDDLEVFMSYSTDSGENWSAVERVSNSSGVASTPHVAVTTNYIHVVWLDTRDGNNYEAYHRRRSLAGGCATGETDCGGTCVDTQSNAQYCGDCDTSCASGEVCNEGQCDSSCASGLEQCGNDCVDTQTSLADCGGCGMACAPPNAVGACVSGECAVDSCTSGFTDDDGNPTNGCEVAPAAGTGGGAGRGSGGTGGAGGSSAATGGSGGSSAATGGSGGSNGGAAGSGTGGSRSGAGGVAANAAQSKDEGGCGCEVVGRRGQYAGTILLAMVALATASRRRRRDALSTRASGT